MTDVRIVSEVPATSTEGSERLINELQGALARRTRVVTVRVPVSWRSRWTLGAVAAIRGAPRADVLHFYPIGSLTHGALIRARLWRRASRVPLVFHAFQHPAGDVPSGRAIRAAIGGRGVVVSPSPKLIDTLRAKGVPTHFVPSSVDTDYFRPPSKEERAQARALARVRHDERLILHVGHVRQSRNLSALIDMAREGRRVGLVVSPRLHADPGLLEELVTSGVTVFRNTFSEIRMAYWSADVYLFPVTDPRAAVAVPLSVLEALACGLPVVSTRFDGLIAALGETWPGVYWSAPSELGARIDAALTVSPDRDAMRKPLIAAFGLSAISERFLQIYRSLEHPQ